MRPQGDRCWRKAGRRALRGIPTGRRATHRAETAYGQQQRLRDQAAQFAEFIARRREAEESGKEAAR